MSDIKQWDKVERLVRHGFFFESVGEAYPAELSEVDAFAKRHSEYLFRQRERYVDTFAEIEAALNMRPDR
jgi:hypothetical protein